MWTLSVESFGTVAVKAQDLIPGREALPNQIAIELLSASASDQQSPVQPSSSINMIDG